MRQFNKPSKATVYTAVFLVAFLCAAAMIFWRCKFGFANIDESFYLTIPYRLTLGDALFKHEWNLAQMAGFILYPFFEIYVRLNGGLSGVVLHFRYLCAAIQCAAALFIFYRLRRINLLGAAAAALSFLLYIPFNVFALSYNSMCIMALSLAGVILLTAENYRRLQYTAAGLCFALSVLCCPYLVLLYLIYALCFVIKAVPRGRAGIKSDFGEKFLFVTLGCIITALIFLLFVLSRASVRDILMALPGMLDDPQHQNTSVFQKIYLYLSEIFYFRGIINRLSYLAIAALLLLCGLDRKRAERRYLYFALAALLAISLMRIHISENYSNFLMWPINILGPFLFLLSDNRKLRQIFHTIWVPGMIYTFCSHLASNQGIFAIFSSAAVPLLGSILMLCIFAAEAMEQLPTGRGRVLLCVLTAFMLSVQIGAEAYQRYSKVFWSGGLEAQTEAIEHGSHKGLMVAADSYRIYCGKLEALERLKDYDARRLLYLSTDSWLYLNGGYEFGCYSSWPAGIDEATLARYESYYSLNPEKMPDAVFADSEHREIAEKFCRMFSYSIDEYDNCLILTPMK